MAATGELIRLINYVDDISTTLRRISASIPLMDVDERIERVLVIPELDVCVAYHAERPRIVGSDVAAALRFANRVGEAML